MRILARQPIHVLLVLLLAMVTCVSSVSGEQTAASKASNSSAAFAGNSVARLISLESDAGTAFTDHLRDCCLPVWIRLRNEGIVTSVSVFELSHYDATPTDASARDYLVLAGLGPQAKPNDLANAEKASACREHRDIPTLSVLRSALMSCTPNSCYGMPEPAYTDAASGIDFLVEFIGVEDSPLALAKYREIMSKYAGPANGILVERGMLHCFVALESVGLLSDTPGAVPWNQIHISDDWDVGGDVDWDSVYTELFRSEFSCDQDSVWAELPPTDKTSADYHGRLIPKLCVR